MEAALDLVNDGRIAFTNFDGQPAWLKRGEPAHAAWRYSFLSFFARRLQAPLLAPVYKTGGTDALAIERSRISTLRSAGISVPEILAVGPDWHLLASVGLSLRTAMRSADRGERALLAQRAVHAVRRVHQKGQYLSQAFDRNMCVNEATISFIDFEDDPLAVFTLQEAQARDWLLLLTSLASHFENDPPELDRICRAALTSMSLEQTTMLKETVEKLRRLLTTLPGSSRVRELRRIVLLGDRLRQL